jgi:hypothetical protein
MEEGAIGKPLAAATDELDLSPEALSIPAFSLAFEYRSSLKWKARIEGISVFGGRNPQALLHRRSRLYGYPWSFSMKSAIERRFHDAQSFGQDVTGTMSCETAPAMPRPGTGCLWTS